MKANKYTAALVALGVVSLASAAHAVAPNIVYLVGASALRTTFFTAGTTAGVIFDATGEPAGDPKIVSTGANATSGSTFIVYEGNINGNLVDIDTYWTGAEAAVADVAGHALNQTLNNGTQFGANANGTFPVPGTPASFLNPNTSYSGSAVPLTSIAGAPSLPNLALDDTSQAVSLTPFSQYPLVDYGAIAVVPFTFLKGYQLHPDPAWTHLTNLTTAQVNEIYSGPVPAAFVTGIATDNAADGFEAVVVTGRNLSSGTRVNALLTAQYGVTTAADQWAYDVSYPTAGVLTAGTAYTSPGTILEVLNDGFNTAGPAAAQLNFDGSGQETVLIEPLAITDAQSAANSLPAAVTSAGGQPATYLSYNGVYESDSGIIEGTYPFWGNEHIFGSIGQSSSSIAGQTGLAIENNVKSYILAQGYGTATGAVGPTYSAQSTLIPESLLQVTRTGDGGFPAPKN